MLSILPRNFLNLKAFLNLVKLLFVFFISDSERYFLFLATKKSFLYLSISFLENLCLNSSKSFLNF